MGALAAVALLLRRLRPEAPIVLLLFVVVATTSFLFAAAPRLFNRVTDDAVRYAVATASPIDRDIWLNASGFIGAGNLGGVSAVRDYGQLREADVPASIAGIISEPVPSITSVRFAVPNSIVGLIFRYQDGVTDASRLVSGRWPVDRGMPLQQIRLGQQGDTGEPASPSVFEVALSTTQAEAIDAHVGDRLNVVLDSSDAAVPKSVFAIAPTEIDVVGLYDPLDANAPLWVGSGLLQPTLKQGPSGVEGIYATALFPADAYPSLAASLLPFRFDWRFGVDSDSLDADQVEPLNHDLQQLGLVASTRDNRYLSTESSSVGLTNVSFNSGLPRIFEQFAAVRARSESVLSIAALGLLGLAGGATAMVAILLVRRRRASLLLARGRGASGSLLLGAQLVEAILVTGGAALVGLLLAMYAVAARDTPLSPILALVVAGTATLLLVAATWPAARRPLMQLERDDPRVVRVAPRRLVIEATVVVIAVMAVVLLRQRGLTLGPTAGSTSFDPLLAAVPLLCGLAAGIVAMRLYPLPIRGLGGIAARRSDFVPVVGLRTVARHPATANLPLLVLMLTAAFGAFASVVGSSIDRGQVAASYLAVGADYRLEEIGIGGLPPSLSPSTVPGVQAVASGVVDSSAAVFGTAGQRTSVDLDAIDAAAYETVTAGTVADPAWPSTFLAQPSVVGAGTEANPIPAILSTQLPPAIANLRAGDTFRLTVAQQSLTFRLVQQQATFPGHGDAATFVIVPLAWMRAAEPANSLVPTVMWLRASSDAAAPLGAMVSAAPEAVRIVSRQAAYGLLHDAPLGSAVAGFFGVSLGVAVLYMAVTLVGAVIISVAGGSRDLAYLRTLGVSRRQAQGLTAVEQTPPVLLALIPGILLGVSVALLVEPGLGLADFVGAPGVPLTVNWAALGIIIVALSAVVAIAVVIGTWLGGRSRLASALRIEES